MVTSPRVSRRSGRRARAVLVVGLITGLAGLGVGAGPAAAGVQSRVGVAGAAAGSSKVAALRPRPTGKLSPRLRLLAGRSGFASPRAQARALSLPLSGPGSLATAAPGRVLVEIRASTTSPAAIARLRALGGHIVNVNPKYSVITASVARSALDAMARDSDVAYVSEVLRPITSADTTGNATGYVIGNPSAVAQPAAGTCRPTISEGDTLMNVASARATHQVNGAGQTIGIISDSFGTSLNSSTHAAQDVATGDLPGPGNPCGFTTPVTVRSDLAGQTDEGRAMAELAHGLAPGAHLAFATGGNGQFDFASQIDALRTASGATVIVDDLAYLDEPFFQDGPIAQAANAASAAGVSYFSAAGNSNVIVGGNDVSSYEAPAYRSTACPASVLNVETLLSCHDFDPAVGVDNGADITLVPGGGFAFDLQWAQPWGITGTDFDAFLVNSAGTVVASSRIDQGSLREPFEFFGYTNNTGFSETVHLVIGKFSGAANPRLKFVLIGADGITAVQYDTSSGGDIVGPTIFGHSGAATVGSTAAIPYDDPNSSEAFSSHGPMTLYFQPTPSTTPLASPLVLDKPDFAATDNVQNVFFAVPSGGVFRFPGTSAAAPQAAAIGALLRQHDPALTPAQVIATLRSTARPVANNGAPSDVGGGYLDAQAALSSVVPLPGVARLLAATNGNARVTLQWSAAPSGPTSPITGYTVTPIKGGVAQAPRVFNSAATRQVIAGLTNGGSYTFTVVGRNANGAGSPSPTSSAIVVGRPGKPGSVSAAPGNGRATVKWAKPTATYGLPIVSYQVLAYAGETVVADRTFNATATRREITGLANKSNYRFAVRAINATSVGFTSDRSNAIFVGSPRAPLQVTATSGNGNAFVRWLKPPENGAPLIRYTIRVYTNGALKSVVENGTKVSRTFKTLTNGARYTFRVTATNSRGEGPPASAVVIVGTPLAPTGVSATAGRKNALVHWIVPPNNGKPITGYTVTPYLGTGAGTPRVFSGTATSRTVGGLVTGRQYTFRVEAKNARGLGAPSVPTKPVKVT